MEEDGTKKEKDDEDDEVEFQSENDDEEKQSGSKGEQGAYKDKQYSFYWSMIGAESYSLKT